MVVGNQWIIICDCYSENSSLFHIAYMRPDVAFLVYQWPLLWSFGNMLWASSFEFRVNVWLQNPISVRLRWFVLVQKWYAPCHCKSWFINEKENFDTIFHCGRFDIPIGLIAYEGTHTHVSRKDRLKNREQPTVLPKCNELDIVEKTPNYCYYDILFVVGAYEVFSTLFTVTAS